jgi:hypothetical protein
MWTRRLLLATMVAAAAMSLPRHVPASWSAGLGAAPGVAVSTSLR